MWIKMNETYVGGIGTFKKGERYDLPPRLLKCIPVFVPQEGHKDKPSGRKYYGPCDPPPEKPKTAGK